LGIDPIATAAQIIMGIQTIVKYKSCRISSSDQCRTNKRWSKKCDSEELIMTGTIRSLDVKVQEMLHSRLKKVVTSIAESAGATAEVNITNQTYTMIPH
jgi:metal-dependent amidase/aminoacylase/carboxypeptidase family protein